MHLSNTKAITVWGVALGVLLFCFPAFSQLNLGRIFGAITDQSGGAVVGATVTVLDVARGISRPLVSDGAGEYSAPSLTPGMYTVRAEAKGFKIEQRTDIVVGVGQDVRVDLTLQPGEQTQTITVTGELPMVNTSNAMLGGTLENNMINELPTNGRDYTQLLSYKPGILQIPGSGANAFISNGAGYDMNVWLFDGIYDCNPLNSDSAIVGGGFTGGAQANILPLDAIQEVNVIENPSAEYGWKHGAVVNTGLKSGTNTVHGTAFASGRDTAMDAKNAFLGPTQTKALDNIEQFGATVGGPIKKDKLFYFGAYEGQRLLIGVPSLVTEPTLVSVGGTKGTSQSFPDAIADMVKNGHPISQLSLNLAGCTTAGVCNPAISLFGGNTQGANVSNPTALPVAFNNQGGSNNALEKIDYHPNDHNAINGEYFFGQGLTLYGGAITEQWWRTGFYQRVNVARGVWVWTPNSTWVNEMRFGLDRINFPVFTDECQGANFQSPAFNPGPNYATQYGFVTGAPICGFPTMTVSGFTALGMPGPIQTNVSTIYSGQDSVSYTRGKHLFKFGGEIHDTLWNGAAVTNGRGTVAIGTTAAFPGATALEDFLSGTLDSGSTKTRVLAGSPARNVTMDMYAVFVQDDWRITPRVTLNLGVRWELEPPLTDRNNLFGNFNPSTPSGLEQAGIGGIGSEVYKASLAAVGPRFGIVWDVFGKGRTVVRAGSSIVYETPALLNFISNPQGASLNSVPTGFTLIGANGTAIPSPGTIKAGTIAPAASALNWTVGTPIFNTSPSGLVCSPTSPCVISVINPNFRRSKEINYTLGIQHAFTNNLSLNLSYVGNDALGLSSAVDINQPTLGPKTGEQQRRPYYNQFPYLGNIFYYTYSAQSIYQGLQAALTERVVHGLNFTVGYTYQNALEDNRSEQQNAPPMDSYNPLLDWGESNYGAHQHFSIAGTYVIPGKKSPGQLLEGWQVNSSVTLLTGFPINALDSTSDISGTGEAQDRWTLAGNPRDFTPGPAPIPCFGAAGSSFAKAGCAALPAACITAATNEANGPGGTTGIASLNTLGCYMEGSAVIVPPAQGTYGTMSKDALFGKPFHEWDFSVSKNWKFKERLTAQFRAEFFNILNRTAYANPTLNPNSPANFGLVAATPNTGSPAVGSGSPRLTQLELKFTF